MTHSIVLPLFLCLGLVLLPNHPSGVVCVGNHPSLEPDSSEDFESFMNEIGPHLAEWLQDSPPYQPAMRYDPNLDAVQLEQQQSAHGSLRPGGESPRPDPYSRPSDAGSLTSHPFEHADASRDIQQLGTHSAQSSEVRSSMPAQRPNQQPVHYDPYSFRTDDWSHQIPRSTAANRGKAVQADEIDPNAFWKFYHAGNFGPKFQAVKRPAATAPVPTAEQTEPAPTVEEAVPQLPHERVTRPRLDPLPAPKVPYRDVSSPEVPEEYDFYSTARRAHLPRSAFVNSETEHISSYKHDQCFRHRSKPSRDWVQFSDFIINPEAERALVLSKVRYELDRWPAKPGAFTASFRPVDQDRRSDETRKLMLNRSLQRVKHLGRGRRGPFNPFVVNGVWIHFHRYESERASMAVEYHVTGWKPPLVASRVPQGRGLWNVRAAYDLGILRTTATEWGWSPVDFVLKSDRAKR